METYVFDAMRASTSDLEVGSDDWLEGMSSRMQYEFEKMERFGAERLLETMRSIWPHKPWEKVPKDHPSKRADVYIEGITGQPWKVLLQVVEGFDAELANRLRAEVNPGEKTGRPPKDEESNDNIITSSEQGTSKSYTLNRLKRESPDLFNAVIAGTISANAAAIEAGFRKPTIQISGTMDAGTIATKIREKFGEEFADALKAEL